jgi:ATP-dependent Clp protease ATP-binding subunit ClpB
MFGSADDLIRLDMTEYSEQHSVSKLIGSPPGYVGYEQGGVLTESVRRRPYQVLLFDEIEKANPDVFNVFLQILDDGRLTDGQGHVVNFTNTIIIMTSNLPDMEAVKKHFRPEFINRIDEIVFFNPLGKDVMSGIVRIQLSGLEKRLSERRIGMNVTDKAIKWLGDNGYDAVFGARPLKRLITSAVEDKIADLILSGTLNEGSTVYIDVKGKDLTVN